MAETVYVSMDDIDHIPWQAGCHVCSVLKKDLRVEGPMYSLVVAISTHMDRQHDIELRYPE
jgi:hypothetical protein